MNRTLLVEEGDDEGDNRQDKKKREKEKFPDTAEKKKKMAFKKADGKKDIHHNNSLTSSSKVQPAEMADMAAVNPDAEGITSPVGSPAVILPGTNVYQGNIVIPPPPRPVTLQQIPPQQLQQRANWPQQQQQQMTAVYVIPATQQPHFIPTPFQSPGPPPQQIPGQFVGQPYQQGHFAVPQYHQAGGTPVQGVVYSGQAIVAGSHHAHVLTRAQSLPSSASPPGDQAHSSGQPGWVARPPASPPPFSNAESSWAAAEPREERTWSREDENPANDNVQWAAFSPDDPSHANAWINELDEEHSSESDEDVDRSSSPELAGEEGEVLLRAPSLASFAESISSLEEESEDNVWRILPEQREYYTKQFKRLQPVEDGVVQGPRARDFFMKSSLPVELLSKIWHLSDINKDNALNLAEFCIAMHLVVALRHGLELPSTLPNVLLPEKKEAEVDIRPPLEMPQQTEENEEHEVRRRMSSPDHWLRFSERPPSHDATSPPATFTNSTVRRKAHSVVQPIPLRGDLQGDEDIAARPRSLSDPTTLEDATTDGLSHRAGPIKPLHIVVPQSPVPQADAPQAGPTSPSQAISAEIEIARPRATVKLSLLDALPGQLLPPPSGKQARDGWTPTSKFIYQKDPTSPGPSSSPPSSPEEGTPTSPLSPEGRETPSPPLVQEIEEEERPKEDAGKEEVVYRVNRRSGERPRSTGDVKISNKNESSLPTTPVDEEGQSSVSSEERRDPPPPPPRNKKGHSRSSSLDLNKLFATKAKENKGTPPSSSSSYSSQTGDGVPPTRSEPTTPRHRDEKSTSDDKVEEEGQENQAKVEKQEDFADFSRFESFVEAQESVIAREGRRGPSPRPGQHRRSFSLDHSREVVWSQPPQKTPSEAVTTTPSRPPHNQEALPRPVPKLKPPSPPTLKQGRRLDKDGEKERKLKTEPPKVVVRPLTKEDKLNSRINDVKEKNAALSKVNSELQEEIKMIMERRATLEVKLEKLKSPSTPLKHETANN